MTNPVIISPQELRDFARQLNHFSQQLGNDSARLNAQFRRLGDTWRDPAYVQFAQEFEQTLKNLERFRRLADETAPKLMRKADKADEVHR